MNAIRICLFTCLLTLSSVEAASASGWKLTLTDGSKVFVDPQAQMLQLDSEPLDTTLRLPVSKILKTESADGGEVLVTLVNGDQLTGTFSGPSLNANSVFGKVAIRPDLIRGIEKSDHPGFGDRSDRPGEFQIDYAGLRWDIWRTGWQVEDGKLASLRRVRPGFEYGHWARGRGGMVITGNGDKDWKDYEVAFDYKMLPANREFFHAHIPGDSRGMGVFFRAAGLSESWNQPSTGYALSINPNGTWGLSARNGWHMTGKGWNSSKVAGESGSLVSGKAEQCEDASEGRLRLRVKGQTISAWLNKEKLFEFNHQGGELEPIPYGGFGVQWRWESMGEISNLKVKHLLSAKWNSFPNAQSP